MRLHRLVAILLLIESRGHIKAKELARALETSVRTIYRDIETLNEAGVPIAAVTGPFGGIYLMEGYQVAMNSLYGDDVINLYLCGIGIRPDGHSDAGIKLQNALLRLEKSLPPEYSRDIKKARECFYYDENPWWGKRAEIPCLELIRKSVWQSKKLRILYSKKGEAYTERKVLPYGMIVKNMEWYLAAYCENSNEVRTFKCDRIKEAEILEETFIRSEDFSLEQYWRECENLFKEERKASEVYKVTIRLHNYDKELLNNLDVYSSRADNDYIIAVVNMHKYEFACHEAMDIAGKAEITEPGELRKFVSERLKAVIKVYS